MKFTPQSLLVVAGTVLLLGSVPARAESGQLKGPAGKIYVAEAQGDTQIEHGEKISVAKQAGSFDASGTVLETKGQSHNAFVYSNGTGVYVDENTRIEIARFQQDPFKPNHAANANPDLEPSISQSEINVPHGFVGLCTSQLITGSSMLYRTPLALIAIRGGQLAIEAGDDSTTVYLLAGDVTVRAGARDLGGSILKPGERAVIRPAATGQPPSVTIDPIPHDVLASLENRVGIACNSRRTVSFDVLDPNGDQQQVVPKPAVPANPPSNIVVSPDRLPGT